MERIIHDLGNIILEYLDEEGEVRLEVLEEDTVALPEGQTDLRKQEE